MKRKNTPASTDGRQRQHRKDPERTGPIRDWANLYRKPDSRDGSVRAFAEGEPGAAGAGGPDGVVAHGVELGYRVIDEHIRQGQRAASRFNNRDYENAGGRYGAEAAANDVQELVERLLRYSAGLVPQWLELANALAAAPELLRELLRQSNAQSGNGASSGGASYSGAAHHDAAAGDGASAGKTGPVAIEVVSSRAARVTLDLSGRHSGRFTLPAGGLRAADDGRPPLDDVVLFTGEDGERPVMRIRVPDQQPAGVYMGVIVDALSKEPCGTLSVRISAG